MSEMKSQKKFIARILKAVKNKEKIILFGDADPDGVASVIILQEALEILENPVSVVYFPNWEKESYGLNKKALQYLKKQAPALLILLDCGITNIDEIKLAKQMGFTVIVIDHHEVVKELPQAHIIINPKQKGGKALFKELCTAGIVYKLVKALLFEAGKTFQPEKFLELAMLAVIYDQTPLTGENKKILDQGLLCFGYTERIGLKALIEATKCDPFLEIEIRQKIVPALGVAGFIKHKSEAYLLLNEPNTKTAAKIAKNLLEKRIIKKQNIRIAFEQAEAQINFSLPLIFQGSKDWPLMVIATIASRLCQEYQKPVFIYSQGQKESRGTVRVPQQYDSMAIITNCSDLVETYGGHALASGFRIKNKNLDKFEKCLIENLKI